MLVALLTSLRPRQWLKNVFVFAPLIFAQQFTDFTSIKLALATFVIFSLAASGAYLINDLLDREADRLHPTKRLRPIAAGELPVNVAYAAAGALFGIAIGWAYWIVPALAEIIGGYLALQVSYSLLLKHIFLLDIGMIAFGFVLRVMAGSIAIGVVASEWLILLTFSLTLLLVVGKREQELRHLGQSARQTLVHYDLHKLEIALAALTFATFSAYLTYTFLAAPSRWLLLTVPFVGWGLWRYLTLLKGQVAQENPENLVFIDKQFALSVLGFIITAILVLTFI